MIQPRPPLSAYFILLLALLLLFTASVSCTKNQRSETLRDSVVAVNAARDGFTAWDRVHQQEIVDKATSHENGESQLAAYRERRKVVADSFELAYRLLAIAATQNDDPSLKAALAASAEIVDAAKKLIGGQ